MWNVLRDISMLMCHQLAGEPACLPGIVGGVAAVAAFFSLLMNDPAAAGSSVLEGLTELKASDIAGGSLLPCDLYRFCRKKLPNCEALLPAALSSEAAPCSSLDVGTASGSPKDRSCPKDPCC